MASSNPYCKWPGYGLKADHCEQTIAQHFGRAYDIAQLVYLALSLLLFFTVSFQIFRIVKARGSFFPLNVQKKIYYALFIISITFLIRSVDPGNLRGVLPVWLSDLSYELATAFLYVMLLEVVLSWVEISATVRSRGRKGEMSKGTITAIQTIASVALVATGVTLGELQDYVGPTWEFRAFKFLVYIAWCFSLNVIGLRHGYIIYEFLVSMQARLVAQSGAGAPDETEQDLAEAAALDGEEVNAEESHLLRKGATKRSLPRAHTQLTKEETETFNKQRSQLNQLLLLFAFMTLVCFASIVMQFFWISQAIASKEDTRNNPNPPPATLLENFTFDVIQYAASWVLVIFFRHLPAERSDDSV